MVPIPIDVHPDAGIVSGLWHRLGRFRFQPKLGLIAK